MFRQTELIAAFRVECPVGPQKQDRANPGANNLMVISDEDAQWGPGQAGQPAKKVCS
jgi:hypothetical protein